MPSAKKKHAKQGRDVPFAAPRGGKHCRGPDTHAFFSSASSVGAKMFPFGSDGPGLCVQRRSRGVAYTCVHAFLMIFMVAAHLTLGSWDFVLFTSWTWFLTTAFCCMTFCCYWLLHALEAWLLFWGLGMIHGLCWLQLALIAHDGVWPNSLWLAHGGHDGGDILMAQLGAGPLLLVPLLAVVAFIWVERAYLLAIYYDFTSQLLERHRTFNLVWHLCSPVVPFAIWSYAFNPRVVTDLPRWPGIVPLIPICSVCNGALLYIAQRQTSHYMGSVRWMDSSWLVWSIGSKSF